MECRRRVRIRPHRYKTRALYREEKGTLVSEATRGSYEERCAPRRCATRATVRRRFLIVRFFDANNTQQSGKRKIGCGGCDRREYKRRRQKTRGFETDSGMGRRKGETVPFSIICSSESSILLEIEPVKFGGKVIFFASQSRESNHLAIRQSQQMRHDSTSREREPGAAPPLKCGGSARLAKLQLPKRRFIILEQFIYSLPLWYV